MLGHRVSDAPRTCHSLLPTVDNEAYFINPRFLSTSPCHWKIILVLSNFLTALSNAAWNLHCNCRVLPGTTAGKINQQRQTFSCIGRSSKKYHIEYTTSKSLENKISGNLSFFFYKDLTIFMNFIQNNLLNQIKMSKKFVWNLKVLTAGLSIIKMSILLVLPFSSLEKIVWAKKNTKLADILLSGCVDQLWTVGS